MSCGSAGVCHLSPYSCCLEGHDSFIHKIKSVGEASQSSPKVISCDDVGNVIQWGKYNIAICELGRA